MIFECASEFLRELKALSKKWPSLPEDLAAAKPIIEALYTDQPEVDRTALRNKFFNNARATILTSTDSYELVKMRLDCVSLGNKHSLRIVFISYTTKGSIFFLELFSKTDKAREDGKRINKYL